MAYLHSFDLRGKASQAGFNVRLALMLILVIVILIGLVHYFAYRKETPPANQESSAVLEPGEGEQTPIGHRRMHEIEQISELY